MLELPRPSWAVSVDTIFALMGDANVLTLPGFIGDRGGRHVGAAHEGSTVLNATGFAQRD